MTDEQRLDRLERIAKLFVKAGLRARRQGREHDDKINILIDFQMQNEEKAARQDEKISVLQGQNEERFAKLAESQVKQDEKVSILQSQNEERFGKLAESQANTNRRLDSLIDIIREGRNGNSSSKS